MLPGIGSSKPHVAQVRFDHCNYFISDLLEKTSKLDSSDPKVKMAFAEGYMAADGSAKEKSTRTMRFARTFQQVLTVIVLLVLLVSLTGDLPTNTLQCLLITWLWF